jgi:HK97 family phage portal protein
MLKSFRVTPPPAEQRALQVTPWGPWTSSAVSSAGVTVNRDTALNLLTVYGCVQLIADTIATLPFQVLRRTSRGQVDDLPVPRVFERPNEWCDRQGFLTQLLSSLLLDGNAYLVLDDPQIPSEIHVVHPDDVDIRDEQGTWVYYIKNRPNRMPLVHIRAVTMPGQVKGLSPVESARQALGLGLAAQDFGARFFGSGQNLSGVIEVPGEMSADQAAIMRQKWSKEHSGLRTAHEPGVLTGGATWKPISVTPEQAQFLDTRRFTASEIAAQMFLVDPTLLGIQTQGSSLTYSNLEQRGIHLAQYTLMRWIVRLERAFSAMLPRPQFVKFNVNGLQRADLKTRYEAYAIGLAGGQFLLADEAREKEDLGPMPKMEQNDGNDSGPFDADA